MIGAILTGLAGWHGYLVFPFFTLLTFLFHRRQTKATFWPWLVLIAIFSLHQLHTRFITGGFNLSLLSQLLTRIGLGQTDSIQAQIISFSYPKFFLQETRWLTIYFTRFLLVGSAIYMGVVLSRVIRKRDLAISDQVALMLFGFGASVPLLFAQQAFIHDYLNFYLLPGMALATALVLERFLRPLPRLWRPLLIGLVTVGIFLERYPFLQTLQRGEAERAYVDLAKLVVEKRQNPETTFLIEAGNFYNFAYPALWNYAYGTVIDNRNDTLKSFQEQEAKIVSQYDYLVTVSTHPSEAPFLEYLQTTYPAELKGNFTFYKLPIMPVKIPKS